jgi:hypothetical protein
MRSFPCKKRWLPPGMGAQWRRIKAALKVSSPLANMTQAKIPWQVAHLRKGCVSALLVGVQSGPFSPFFSFGGTQLFSLLFFPAPCQ